jgi:hypothetical protein
MAYEDLTNEIEQVEKELLSLKTHVMAKEARLKRLKSNCPHDWTKPIFDQESYQKEYLTGEYETQGIHMYPKSEFRTEYRDRWSRTCKICTVKEYTYERVATQYEPKF